MISGDLITRFVIDSSGRMKYDALMLMADGYNNDKFQGKWTSYKTHVSKKCNWGYCRKKRERR